VWPNNKDIIPFRSAIRNYILPLCQLGLVTNRSAPSTLNLLTNHAACQPRPCSLWIHYRSLVSLSSVWAIPLYCVTEWRQLLTEVRFPFLILSGNPKFTQMLIGSCTWDLGLWILKLSAGKKLVCYVCIGTNRSL